MLAAKRAYTVEAYERMRIPVQQDDSRSMRQTERVPLKKAANKTEKQSIAQSHKKPDGSSMDETKGSITNQIKMAEIWEIDNERIKNRPIWQNQESENPAKPFYFLDKSHALRKAPPFCISL